MHDPKIDPVSGDVLRRWDQNYLIVNNQQGCVFSVPPLISDPRKWVGIQVFREWAKHAEVMHVVASKPKEGGV